MEGKELLVNVKSYTKEHMKANADVILKSRELLVETEGEGPELIARFKVGDGKTPYSQLKYIASIYDLFPNFKLYSTDYTLGFNIKLKED